eukprot:TRINITY_DN12730_c0_g1_i1.p1 TRINITY_DN12730_c0_g1~~TRINITY_DN12730_c0_g1_i1.p1  ORF type:complete len:702 (+),score=229.28 TRINITY_DN12730_c0_g1_i1:73-2178(+)
MPPKISGPSGTRSGNKPQGRISKSNSSMNPDRPNKDSSNPHRRSRATVNRIKMYKSGGHAIRNRKGKIVSAAPFQRTVASGTVARVEPNRRWFGNTRVIGQTELEQFREAVIDAKKDPYTFIMRQSKLPMSLLKDPTKAQAVDILATKPFSTTFGPKAQRKRPSLSIGTMEELAKSVEDKAESYDETKDTDLKTEETGERDKARDWIFGAGQSKRIWSELYKVIDASDVLIQVLDARDPMGTRSAHVEKYMTNEKPHKHLIFVLNKCDLVPTWVTTRWVTILSAIRPTLAFHASINNSFGKGSLIQLLRQFGKLHADKQQISIGLIGYPNVGKSSIINTLKGEKSCKTAPIPGETKVWQYVTLMRKIFLIDCPGVVYPSDDSESDVVLKGVVRVEHLSAPEDHVKEVLTRAKKEYITRTYNLGDWSKDDHIDFLEKLAVKSGKLLKGGEPDVPTVAKMVLHDWQRGKIPYFVPPPSLSKDSKPVKTNFMGVEQKLHTINVAQDFDADDVEMATAEQDEGATVAASSADAAAKTAVDDGSAVAAADDDEDDIAWEDLDDDEEETPEAPVETQETAKAKTSKRKQAATASQQPAAKVAKAKEAASTEVLESASNTAGDVVVKATKGGWTVSKVKPASKRASNAKPARPAKLSKAEEAKARAEERKRVKDQGPKDRRTTSKAEAKNYYSDANVKGRRRKKKAAK